MDDLILVKASKALEKEIILYRQEYLDSGATNINGTCGLHKYENFDEWLDLVLSIEKEKFRDGVHASTFFSVRKSDNKIIGSIQLRHSLTPELKQRGGHIGYGIRPSERKKGYGHCQLELVLDVAKEMEIPKVMITCYKDNIGSSKTALSCGGVLTGENMHKGKEQCIYWIDLSKRS